MFRRAFVASSFVAAVVMPVLALAEDRSLGIDPVYQETPVWCWAAVGQMVFQHNGVGNINPGGDFQCGIVALLHPICNRDCRNCVVPAGSLFTMNNMLTEYPKVAVQRTGLHAREKTVSGVERGLAVRCGPAHVHDDARFRSLSEQIEDSRGVAQLGDRRVAHPAMTARERCTGGGGVQ